ncbi:ABC transporter substrate-binding protein, partial [candidate division KSB1 bacterium]|nr:ABC transporter substrate-binding protein [candidate division KSB1 bacterium]
MKKQIAIILFLFLLIILTGIFYYQRVTILSQESNQDQEKNYQRIISLSPNITEILFALGLGEKVVGVTRFCNYPPEAKEKMQVGGYLDPNYEAIVSLKPDVVIFLSNFHQVSNFLSELNVNYLTVSNETVSDIMSSIAFLGQTFGAEQRVEVMLSDIRAKIHRIEEQTKNATRPKVMIVIERSLGAGVIEDVYIAGQNTFYDELIQLAGGTNVYEDEKISYPILSAEGLIHLNPDFIIDLIPQLEQIGQNAATLKKDWDILSQLDAVKRRNVYIMSEDYAVIPGPRFILFLETLARTIHPEI